MYHQYRLLTSWRPNILGIQISSTSTLQSVSIYPMDDDEDVPLFNDGPYIFTRTLLPLLESTASLPGPDVGSDGHSRVKYLDYGSKEAWNHPFRWFLLPSGELQILAVYLWTNDLARCLSEEQSKVMVLITHPDAILSGGAIFSLNSLPYPPFWIWSLGFVLHPQTRGAYTSVFAACMSRDNPNITHGAYIFPPSVAVAQAPAALDENRQRQLAEFTEEFLRGIGL
ncbi:hypothetical protein ARMSODRAFT_1010241 [Armillaria solidipes]|uniref:Uncharacterized protein n=1 Tax=Armillaria solidipes TaxID=1076256 RepID=A0A2H3B586_9AGAR|nr:hypothetical protein ARMSODRAFT_1010241 [Armillaria solidipes]